MTPRAYVGRGCAPLWIAALVWSALSGNAAVTSAQPAPESEPDAPAQPPPERCQLVESEAPRGGQIILTGSDFGSSPVVRIGRETARLLRRSPSELRAQVPRTSNGGTVIVRVKGEAWECGELRIIGIDR